MKKLFLVAVLVLVLSVSISPVLAGTGDNGGFPDSNPGCTFAWPKFSWNINHMLSDMLEGCVPIIHLGMEG